MTTLSTIGRAARTDISIHEALNQMLGCKFDHSVSLLAWAYNEEALIEDFIDNAIALLDATIDDWEIVLIDDGSTDRTPAMMDVYAAREPRVRVLHNDRNRNVGYSFKRAIASASKDYLLAQTVDWAYDLTNLRLLLEFTRSFTVVQGIRPTPIRLLSYIPGLRSIYRVRSRSDNLRKAVVSLTNYYLLRLLFRVPFQDFQNITIYPTKLIQSCELRGNSSFLNPECLLRTYEKGATYIEVPIKFIPRSAGTAKGTSLRSICRSVTDIFSAWWTWGIRYRRQRLIDRRTKKQIFRISEPFHLDEGTLFLAIPLFKEFR